MVMKIFFRQNVKNVLSSQQRHFTDCNLYFANNKVCALRIESVLQVLHLNRELNIRFMQLLTLREISKKHKIINNFNQTETLFIIYMMMHLRNKFVN